MHDRRWQSILQLSMKFTLCEILAVASPRHEVFCEIFWAHIAPVPRYTTADQFVAAGLANTWATLAKTHRRENVPRNSTQWPVCFVKLRQFPPAKISTSSDCLMVALELDYE